MNGKRRLSDEQIAAHEAGHALVAHVLGEAISEVRMYTGEQSARVRLADAVRAEQIRFAGTVGELLAGFSASPVDACADMSGIDPYAARASPGAITLLQRHAESHRRLSTVFLQTRKAGHLIPGQDVHTFLDGLGCIFGCDAEPSGA